MGQDLARTDRSRRCSGLSRVLLALAMGLPAVTPTAEAQEGFGVVLRIQAEREIAAGRCADALPLLRQARDLAPEDARAAFLEGQCALALGRYREAVEPLEQAKDLDPTLAEADRFSLIALYHLGEFTRAEEALRSAEAALPARADLLFYRGLLLLQRGRNEEAASFLEQARELDAEAVDPAASYYAALAWERAEDPARAEAGFRLVEETAAGTPWADQARRALESLPEGEASGEPRFWGSASVGFEYDDNVVLRGTEVGLPLGIGDESDAGAVWSLDGGVQLLRTDDWAAGLLGSYTGSAYGDLTEFNENYPSILGWIDRRLTESTFLRVQPDFGFVWFGGDPYLLTYGTTVLLYRDLGPWGTTSVLGRYARLDFRYRVPDFPPGPDPGLEAAQRNRDGDEFTAGLDYSRPLGEYTSLTAGYRYRHFDTEGIEYDHQAHEILLGARRELPYRFALDIGGSYAYQPYENPSTFPDPPGSLEYLSSRREEHTWRLDAVLERPVHRRVTASIRYSYLKNDSNVRVFDYDRNRVGFYLTVAVSE